MKKGRILVALPVFFRHKYDQQNRYNRSKTDMNYKREVAVIKVIKVLVERDNILHKLETRMDTQEMHLTCLQICFRLL